MASHLLTLIKRVRAIPHRLRVEPSHKEIFKGRLINLAEYMRYEQDYSEFEANKAKALLKAHGYEFLLDIDDDEEFEKTIRSTATSSRICIRCGRQLSDPNSVMNGFGPECFSKRGKIVDASQEKLKRFFDDDRFTEESDDGK